MSSIDATPARASSVRPHRAIPAKGLWLLAALAVFWGVNWPVMKIVLNEWNVWHFRAVCLLAGALSFFTLAKMMGYPLRVPKGEWGHLFAAGLLNVTGWQLLSGF